MIFYIYYAIEFVICVIDFISITLMRRLNVQLKSYIRYTSKMSANIFQTSLQLHLKKSTTNYYNVSSRYTIQLNTIMITDNRD
eukprot:GAHX01003744.1.p1 GENE.GAHX01003744.1~~GAHX01003744.1.p1  ORF type:complete len:83 (+),score=2.07 GAHX01003744.1:103-351(+)